MIDRPPYTPDRFLRCVAKYVRWRATAIRDPRDRMAQALANYWERAAQRALRG